MASAIPVAVRIGLGLFDWVLKYPAFLYYCLFNPKNAWQRARDLQERAGRSHQKSALLSSLADFQKAQCYFYLTLTVAAFISLTTFGPSAEDFTAERFLDIYNGSEWEIVVKFIKALAVAGAVPASFTCFMLYINTNQNRSGYITALTSVTVISLVILRYFDFGKPEQKPGSSTYQGDACGRHLSPRWACQSVVELDTLPFYNWPLAWFSLTVQRGILVHRLLSS
jgi:hypothetical protein